MLRRCQSVFLMFPVASVLVCFEIFHALFLHLHWYDFRGTSALLELLFHCIAVSFRSLIILFYVFKAIELSL